MSDASDLVEAAIPPRPAEALSALSRQIADMVAAWRRGERPLAEELLARHPELDREAAIRVIFEEYCLREETGENADPAEVMRRFPQLRDELEVLFDCHRLLESHTATAFPDVGELFAGFRLLAELGRGASGRIFLAEQPSLADRPVVLKITTRAHEEHLSLARLQHMNIIPLYSEQVLADRNVRLLCMPFLGGATLAQILDRLGGRPAEQRAGAQIIEAIDHVQAALPIAPPSQGPFRQYLARAPYASAICWIGACLADGLQYAHERGLVHMDIKPSNVLLTGDGQPMLLDFHLTRGPIGPAGPVPVRVGGTPEYVSPEQRAAMAAVGQGRRTTPVVDGRSDIYSLGLLLYEALGGPGPLPESAARPALFRRNPRVSAGLSDIVHKCLRPDARDRYQHASALAADLRRHLDDLPLRGVPNQSIAERWRKWRRRQPAALPRNLILLVSVVSAIAAAIVLRTAYRQRVHDIETALLNGRFYQERRQYAEAVRALRVGSGLAERTPFVPGLRDQLAAELGLARRDGKALELHRLADLVRFRYGIDPPVTDEARSLVNRGSAIWAARKDLVRPTRARTEPDVERTIRTDLLDFAVVWADLLVRLAPPAEIDAARARASQILDEAEDLLGPSPALERDRVYITGGSVRWESARDSASHALSAWDHYDLGKFLLRTGDVANASEELRSALAIRPQDFWPNFYLGLCAYRLGRFEDAIHAFDICVALAPETAECFYNRALARASAGQTDAAFDDYTRAFALNPSLTDAAMNRGILSFNRGRHDEAAADFDRALLTTADRQVRGSILYNLALVELARGDRSKARQHLETAAESGHQEATALRKRLER